MFVQSSNRPEPADVLLGTSKFNLGRNVPNRVPYFTYKVADPVAG